MKSLIAICLLPILLAAAAPLNVLPNPSLEQPGEKNSPAHWWAVTFWGKDAEFGFDKTEKHDGAQSFRIVAKEPSQSWLICEPIPVAPGEKVSASAWVKIKDIKGKGVEASEDVYLMATFVEGDGRTEQFVDFVKADKSKTDWQELKGEAKVPPRTANVRLRVGFRNVSGTGWIDDVKLLASTPLIARVDLNQPRLTPEMGGVPVLIINRDGRKGHVNLHAKLGSESGAIDVQLSGAATQPVVVPVPIVQRGNVPLEFTFTGGGANITDKRKVTVPPELVLSPVIPTHWAVEDGPATIEGDIDLAASPEMRRRAELSVSVTGTDAYLKIAKPVDGINHFSIKLPELAVGEYKVSASFAEHNSAPCPPTPEHVDQPFVIIHRADAETHLNKDGYIEYKGKPIFPLGIFNGGAKTKEMGAAGFTIGHAYNAANAEPGERPNDEGCKEFLDSTEANGMKAILLIPRGFVFNSKWDDFRRRVKMFRNHPALLAWDEEEGLARGDMDLAGLHKMHEIIREEDPHHPLMIGDTRGVITDMKPDRSDLFPVAEMDLGMWWWYPFPAGAKSGLEGDELTKAKELLPPSFLLKNLSTGKPLWVGVQSYKKEIPSARYPTPTEYRAQAYIAIIHGAKGLMWYGGSVEGGIYLDPKEGHWDDLKKLARELHDLSDVFMGETLETPKFEPADAPISVAIKRGGGRTVLMAVNRGTKPFDISFDNGVKHHFDGYETFVQEMK